MWQINIFGHEFYDIFYGFFLYCFFGWIYECIFESIRNKTIMNRGFLNGPVIPIYGCGAMLVYIVLSGLKGNVVMIYVLGLVMATALEYITSFVMEKMFHMRWWDYTDWKFNFKGRICLLASTFWGFMAVMLVYVFQPGMDRIIEMIPRETGEILGYVILVVFIADLAVTIVYTVELDHLLGKMQKLRQDMQDYLFSGKFIEAGEEIKEKLANVRISSIFVEAKTIFESKLNQAKSFRQYSRLEIKEQIPEKEAKMREFFRRYQNLRAKKIHIRLIRAFPTLRVDKREAALSDVKERISKKGVLELSKELRDDVTGKIKSNLSGILRAVAIVLLVFAQFVLIIYLTYRLRGYTLYIYSFIQVLSIIIIIALVNDNRNTSYKISWICIIAAFPITGHIMFMLWGNRRGKKIERNIMKKMQHGAEYYEYNPEAVKKLMERHPTKSRMTRYLELNGFPLYKNNKVEYYSMGEDAFEAIFKEMNKAQSFILMDFFIVAEGLLWERLHSLLLKKIEEGVKVLFMYDDFGAMLRTPNNFKKDLEKEGFEIRVFNPMLKYTDKLYMNYRSHQKIIVVDGNVGFTGGMNLADEYVNLVPRFGTWKDNAVRVEGDAVWGLTVTFLQMWEVATDGKPIDYRPYRPTKKFEENDVFCQVVSDGPANNPRNPVESIYKQMIYYAKKILYITTPYLIIEDDMREALITAAASGIDVRIITPNIPDKKHVKMLTNYNYGRLLEAGVRIFEYTPGFIHAKTIISEDTGIVGTVNMDYRSFHLHYECGVWICNEEVIHKIKIDLLKTMEKCHEVTYEEWKDRPFKIKVYQMVLNLFSTLM